MTAHVEHTFEQALARHKAGQLDDAERSYREILAFDPNHSDSLHLLGVIAYHRGQIELAFDLIGRAIALNGRVADFHCNMGLALFALQRRDEAIRHYEHAIALDPRHAISYNNLGNALVELGSPSEGEAQLRRAVELQPDYAEAHGNLGNALAAQGRLQEAVAHFRCALALAPGLTGAQNNLGVALEQLGKTQEAATQFRRVLELNQNDASAHYNLGNTLRAQGAYTAAIEHYRNAVASRPGFADAWNNLGAALAELGALGAARDAYAKAVEIAPTRAAYHRNLANSKRFEPGDPQLAVMQQLIQDPTSVPEQERIDLHYALAKALADVGQHERSFEYLLVGNALKRRQIAYDPAGAANYMDRVRRVFDSKLMRELQGAGDPSQRPVFIVGMPRSGTSLVEQILASHPEVFGAGELYDLDRIVANLKRADGGPGFPEVAATISGNELHLVAQRYLAAIDAKAPNAQRVTDKMPWNFHFIGLIRLALPNARIIHLRRDPVDTCMSCFSILFDGDNNLFTYDLRELGRFYRDYEALMGHWRSVLPAGVMLEVQYEELVADLEQQARRIVAHCGLEWNDNCLAFHETKRPVRTSSVAQVRQPIYRTSIGRWRPYHAHMRPLFEALQINADGNAATLPPVTGPGAEDHAEELHRRGVVAHQAGNDTLAIDLISRAIALDDKRAQFHCNIGAALHARGRLDEAEAHYLQALRLDPDLAEAHNNLGNVLKELGRPDAAERHCRNALAIRPGYAEASYNLANALMAQGKTAEAIACYRQAIDFRPGFAQAYYNLGSALHQAGEFSQAASCYRQALVCNPHWGDAYNNLGTVLHEAGHLSEAEACYRGALTRSPTDAQVLSNLAGVLRSSGRIEEAIRCLERAVEIAPDNAVFHTNLIFARNFAPTLTTVEHQAERGRWHERHAHRFAAHVRPHTNNPDPWRKLRVGYVSGNFCHQAATYSFGGVIQNHDPKQFEVFCYSDTAVEDDITERLRARADKWRRTAQLPDVDLAELIRTDRVDILVDVVGHMRGHRLLVFAQKPAPVQVTAWGEPTGTGLQAMDYLFADPVLIPADERKFLPEKVFDLPNFLGYWVPDHVPEPGSLPVLERGYITFGSLNRLDKLQDLVLQTWAKILHAVPGSRIILKDKHFKHSEQRDRVLTIFADHNIAADRITLLPSVPRIDHFAAYRDIDLALDPFPHGGGMTTLDALWMGVPTIAFAGHSISSRLAAASLTAVGLGDFIAPDVGGYVDLAVTKAAGVSALAGQRATLRERLAATDFGDPVRYARAVERAYRDMWKHWVESLST